MTKSSISEDYNDGLAFKKKTYSMSFNITRSNRKIIWWNAGKVFDKYQHILKIKTVRKLRIKVSFLKGRTMETVKKNNWLPVYMCVWGAERKLIGRA